MRTRLRLTTTAVLLVAALAAGAAGPVAHADEAAPPKVTSRMVLLSDGATPVKTWSAYPVHVRLEAEGGTPLAGRAVRIWDDSYARWRCCGPPPWLTTDSDGEVSTVLRLDGNSAHPVRIAAYWHGDATYEKAIAEWDQPMLGYDTALVVDAPAQRTSGQVVPVTVSVRRTDPVASSTGCIDGAVVRLDLTGPASSTTDVTVHTDADGTCSGSVDLPSTLTPGSYTLTASTGHDGWARTDEPSTVVRSLRINWEHTFTDAAGRGTVFLSVANREYRVVLADGRDSGTRSAGGGLTRVGVTGTVSAWRIDLNHQATNGDRATGTFYSTGAFTAAGTLGSGSWQLSR